MKETLISKVLKYVSEKPEASSAEIAEALGSNKKVVDIYLARLEKQEKIRITYIEGQRSIVVLEVPKEFKRSVYEMMVEKYLDDFEAAELYVERLEIGKLILRLLERM